MMKINFENNFQRKVMVVTFPEETLIASDKDVMELRSQWMAALKSWHSPYKAVVDLANLSIRADDEAKVRESLARMLKFLEGLFLRKAVAFGFDASRGHGLLPFEIAETEDEAREKVGLREGIVRVSPGDFRSSIQLQNHFRQHTVELSFAAPVLLESVEQVAVLKSKIMNNLMQWHSKWNLLVDCANLEISPVAREALAGLEKPMRGFFMKEWIGYAPKGDAAQYPFKTFRARHNAVARLEAEGLFSGDSAQCKTGVPTPK